MNGNEATVKIVTIIGLTIMVLILSITYGMVKSNDYSVSALCIHGGKTYYEDIDQSRTVILRSCRWF
jgi:hypothetical protein